MRPLRIGINALYLIPGGVGGTEIYLRCLLAALSEVDSVNRYFVFANRETGVDLLPDSSNFALLPQPVHANLRPFRILWEQTGLPLDAVRRRIDVLLNPGFTAPLLAPCPQVTVFHDLQHIRHPEYFRWFDLPFWNFFLYSAAHISQLLIAPSASTRADLLDHYRLPPAKVRMVPSGVDPAFFQISGRRTPEPFLLAVSTLHPHKNLEGLLQAFARFRQGRDFRLVVCGLHGFHTQPLLALRDSLGLHDAVDFPGWIPRQDLYDLFARASAFVYPSLFEGFGLPLLEALAAGIPTACSAISPLREIAADAALQFEPDSPAAFEHALHRIVDDEALRRRLSEAGPRRAAAFSWHSTAQAILNALSSVSAPGLG